MSKKTIHNIDNFEINLKYINEVIFEKSVDSTQTRAKEYFSLKSKNFVVIAEEQTNGVGRFKREWKSPINGGFYGSFVFKDNVDRDRLSAFNLFISLALVETFKYYTDEIVLKWPNDVYLNGKKVSGLLTEYYNSGDEEGIILGIGINLNPTRHELVETAITLSDVFESKVNIQVFTHQLLKKVNHYYGLYRSVPFSKVREEYLKYSNALGNEFTFTTLDEQFKGKAVDIDDRGFLKVYDESGKIRTIMSADLNI
ncbi:biotin--[acetyl-CoA-carboxylase] ligase [Phocicoccus pinnipedialis]|uniref:biotin--[biotin carboxyl-carrier protein] ligase n=1 Tax=Phocicoccus pinnipedialis TaxID=110845 RepID=A0A6V7RCX2_9BACL|nr:biotin--[acetyl-CoA-carboxylase] ligase [Jeotgalicoccus pinnipedialis]MBP1939381.1 BirA family biotin operon repressor/biotin-[acetyl-CoA-carboxylase] ligase [Jeotgalicoccus pinnipedialis]CAD2075592.1 Bifunctional ligase/repressor BirA [Jeotgalicoccus pinnipedialis]